MWIIVDNGGGYIKCGELRSQKRMTIPNCTGRPRRSATLELVGSNLEPMLENKGERVWPQNFNPSELLYSRPMERGYLTNIDLEMEVWSHMFDHFGGSAGVTGVIVTVPPFFPSELREQLEEMVRDHFKISEIILSQPAELTSIWYRESKLTAVPQNRFCLVVDCGYSFTHVTPVMDGKAFKEGIRRIDVGGKLLTNYLKELVSYGQVNVMDETYVVEELKRKVCYVSLDPEQDLGLVSTLKNQPMLVRSERLPLIKRQELEMKYTRRYVLPDFERITEGYVLDANTTFDEVAHLERQIISLTSECFLVPEILFTPSTLGIDQGGLADVIQDAISACPLETRRLFSQNIILCGGSSKFAHFGERLEKELGDSFRVVSAPDPIECACIGGQSLPSPLQA